MSGCVVSQVLGQVRKRQSGPGSFRSSPGSRRKSSSPRSSPRTLSRSGPGSTVWSSPGWRRKSSPGSSPGSRRKSCPQSSPRSSGPGSGSSRLGPRPVSSPTWSLFRLSLETSAERTG